MRLETYRDIVNRGAPAHHAAVRNDLLPIEQPESTG